MSGAKIYVVNHLANRLPPDIPGFTHLLVGPAAVGLGPESATDKLRNGDSLLNQRWSELSAIYKIWQEGPRSEVVGFCHYRRYLSFSQEMSSQSKYTVSESQLTALMNELSKLEELNALEADPESIRNDILSRFKRLGCGGGRPGRLPKHEQ